MNDEEETLAGESDLFEHHRVVADSGQSQIRIDKFLLDRIPNTSRTKLQLAAKSGCILVNEVPVKQSYKIKPGDEVSIVLPYPVRVLELIPENIPLEILYEDDDLIVLNKQAGLVVHPGHGNYTGTLVNALIFHFQNLPVKPDSEHERPGLVHRLDKLTSGVMVIAKSEKAMVDLSSQFFHRTVDRRYSALVWGDFDDDVGTITGHLGRSLKNRKVMDVFPDGNYGKHAITHYKVLHRYGYVSLVECKLETGRTHQIRVHFQHIRHPLFNDPEYGGDKILKGTTFTKYKQFIQNCFNILPRQALHARSLAFDHPTTKKRMHFETDLPADMTEVLAKWDVYVKSRPE